MLIYVTERVKKVEVSIKYVRWVWPHTIGGSVFVSLLHLVIKWENI